MPWRTADCQSPCALFAVRISVPLCRKGKSNSLPVSVPGPAEEECEALGRCASGSALQANPHLQAQAGFPRETGLPAALALAN